MNKTSKSCGCKGVRTCNQCEASFFEKRILQKINRNVFDYCLHCKKAYLYENKEWLSADTHSNKKCDESKPNDFEQNMLFSIKAKTVKCNHSSVMAETDFNGISLIENFISIDEEIFLDASINETPFQNSQSGRRKQDFGPKVNFKKQKIKLATFNGLPSYSQFLYERMKTVESLKDFWPVELCNLEYCQDRGSHIDPHFDDCWLWGERLVTLNLLSDTCLTFTSDINPVAEVRVPMPRRSLVIISSDARYKWKHSINEADITGRRVAMTFRELSHEFLKEGNREQEGIQLLKLALTFQGIALHHGST